MRNGANADNKICVTKSSALLNVDQENGVSFSSSADRLCQIVTSGMSIRPSVSNATGWQFCQLQATVTVDGGSTLRYFSEGNQRGTMTPTLLKATSTSVTYKGTPPAIEQFLKRHTRFCPSCLPRDYTMRVTLTTLGEDVLSPCPTQQTIEHHIRATTSSVQKISLSVRDAECTTNGTCTDGSSLLDGVQITVRAGECFQEVFLTDGRGTSTFDVPLRDPTRPVPNALNMTLSREGYAPVTLLQNRFDGSLDMGTFFLVKNGAAALHPSPTLSGMILDASENMPVASESVIVELYRGFGVTSGAGALVSTQKLSPEEGGGRYSFPGLEPGIYTVVARANGFIENWRTSVWHDENLHILLSPVVPAGSMRVVLSWGGADAPEDLDLHIKFKVRSTSEDFMITEGAGSVSGGGKGGDKGGEKPAPDDGSAQWADEDKEEGGGGGYGGGYGGGGGGYGGYGDAMEEEDYGDGGMFESEESERECDVFEFSPACGSVELEASAKNSTSGGGESILIQDIHQTVYTVFVRNYLADKATEWSNAKVNFFPPFFCFFVSSSCSFGFLVF